MTSWQASVRLRRWLAVGVTASSLLLALDATAEDPAPEPALELHDEARELYARGDYEGAVARLREAVRLDPDAKTLFYNLGLIEEKMGRLEDALSDYRRCLELEKEPRERDALAAVIKRLEGARQKMRFGPPPPPPAPPPPAPHPRDHGDGVSPWVWVTGGTAMASFIVAAVLASRAAATDPGDDATTSQTTTLEQLEDDAAAAHDLAIGADVTLGLGVAATVATVVVAVMTSGSDDDESVALAVGPTAASLRFRF